MWGCRRVGWRRRGGGGSGRRTSSIVLRRGGRRGGGDFFSSLEDGEGGEGWWLIHRVFWCCVLSLVRVCVRWMGGIINTWTFCIALGVFFLLRLEGIVLVMDWSWVLSGLFGLSLSFIISSWFGLGLLWSLHRIG